jgi:hypothetical protein
MMDTPSIKNIGKRHDSVTDCGASKHAYLAGV